MKDNNVKGTVNKIIKNCSLLWECEASFASENISLSGIGTSRITCKTVTCDLWQNDSKNKDFDVMTIQESAETWDEYGH